MKFLNLGKIRIIVKTENSGKFRTIFERGKFSEERERSDHSLAWEREQIRNYAPYSAIGVIENPICILH